MIADAPKQGLRSESRTQATAAGRIRPILRQQNTDVHFVGFGFEPGKETADSVPDVLFPFTFALDDPLPMAFVEIAPRRIEWDASLASQTLHVLLTFSVGLGLPRANRATSQSLRVIGNDEPVVDANDSAKSAAGLASPDWTIEREGARRGISIVDIALRTVQRVGVAPSLSNSERFR